MTKIMAFSLTILALAVGQARAEQQYSTEQQSYMARLDQLLTSRDDQGLANELLGQSNIPLAVAGLDWAKAKLISGSGLPVQLLYIRDLWRFGAANERLKETASVITLYSLSVVFADGVKCEDRSATDAVFHRLMDSQSFQQTLIYFRQLPKDKQDLDLATAVRMEVYTAPARQNDEYLCRWGGESFADYYRKHGNEGVTEAPGSVGKTLVVPNDSTYRPKFLAPEQWLPSQVAIRHTLPELLSGAVAMVATGKM